jgi:DNA-directed RNA polymerase specialized sigma24 family protein
MLPYATKFATHNRLNRIGKETALSSQPGQDRTARTGEKNAVPFPGLLSAMDRGDQQAADQLLPLVYDELRRLAAALLARENPGQTLEATALVHEAFLRLAGDCRFADRRHFFRVAAEAMRRILIDRARAKARGRRGGQGQRVPLSDAEPAAPAWPMTSWPWIKPWNGSPPSSRSKGGTGDYFAGLSEAEAAQALGVSRATARRYWT